tara:strand:- start:647 stop:994 length:348 start_codon:yes stop_codon:yes gene_type:complete
MINLVEIDLHLAIAKIRPASQYGSFIETEPGNGICDWSKVDWRDKSTTKPTEAEILAAHATIDPVVDKRNAVQKAAEEIVSEKSTLGLLIRALIKKTGITRAELLAEIRSGRVDG